MSRSVCLLAGLLCLTPVALQAESAWVTVMQDQQHQVQFNRSTLNTMPDGNHRIAWVRVLLAENKINPADTPSSYTIIQALNRYDCHNRTIAVVKREYIDQRFNIIKTEQGNTSHLIQPDKQSVDERLWQEACLSTTRGESPPSPAPASSPDIYQLVREANSVTIQASN